MGSKLGIIFAFLLSVAAAGGSYYLYQGWVEERTVRSSVEAKYEQAQERIDTVQSEKEQLKAKSEEYRTKAEAMQAQLEKLQAEQSRIDSEKAALENQLKAHQGMIAELQKQVGELEKKAKAAQAACNVTPADMKTDVFSAPQPFESTGAPVATESTTTASEAGTSQLVFQPVTSDNSTARVMPPAVSTASVVPVASPVVSTASAVSVASPSSPTFSNVPAVQEISPTGEPLTSETAAAVPAVSTKEVTQAVTEPTPAATISGARILTVNRKFNFVVINQGLQDGLKMGDKLKVLKQGQESATIQVEKLYDKFSAATLVEEDPNQQVSEGDEIRKV